MGHIDLAAPVSHIWFFKGVPSRIGYLLDIAPRELEKVLYFAASIVTDVNKDERQKDLADLESKVCRTQLDAADLDREEQLAALEQRLTRRRDYFTKSKDRGFDEDDEFWVRGLGNWAEEQMLPPLEEARELVGGLFKEIVSKVTTEDAKKIRELVRNTAIRNDRQAPAARSRVGGPGRSRDPEGARTAVQGVPEGDRLERGALRYDTCIPCSTGCRAARPSTKTTQRSSRPSTRRSSRRLGSWQGLLRMSSPRPSLAPTTSSSGSSRTTSA